jgi:DNA polymerase
MNPVFIDLETRSACDLSKEGGYNYAQHPTTRLLTVAWQTDGEDHVWLPGLRNPPPGPLTNLHLPDVRVHVGDRVPAALCRVAHRPWVGHNCWTFDRPVWLECTESFENVRWVDTHPLALAAGLPGGIDKIGKLIWGEGKDEAGKNELKKAYSATGPGDCEPENVPIGRVILIAKYNVQDVRLLAKLWPLVQRDALLTPMEQKVLAAHDAINDRGWRVDRDLVVKLLDMANTTKDWAVQKIADLTGGALPDTAAIQSRARVLEWLDQQGFKMKSLRKELVTRFIDSNRSHDDLEDESEEREPDLGGDPDEAVETKNLPLVVNVLELRMQALRITGGKLQSALFSLDKDHRARGLFAYWAAHTGRWGGRRVQVQNLPRPKEGVDTWAFLQAYEDYRDYPEHARDIGNLDDILAMLPIGERGADGKLLYPYLSADDASSGLLRGIFLPNEGDILAAGDYSAIEARVLKWCAGAKGGLDIFWDQGDPYLRQAEKIFGPIDTWPKFPDPKKAGAFLSIKKHPYRQVGKVVVLGSGYQLGAGSFAVYAAANGIDLSVVDTTPSACITAYRMDNPDVAGRYLGPGKHSGTPTYEGGLWRDLMTAALTAVGTYTTQYAGRCRFHMCNGNLICTLPSGRRLVYRNAFIDNVAEKVPYEHNRDFIPAPAYWSPRYGLKYLYGGSLAENIVQAISRDILAEAIVRLEEHGGMPVVGHCHDEAVSSTKPALYDEFSGRLTTCPDWLDHFPLDAECGLMHRYSKTTPPGRKEQVWRNGKFLKGA